MIMKVVSFTAFWRWQHKYVFPERAGIAPFFQMAVGLSVLFYVLNYPRISKFVIDDVYLKL